MLRALLVLLIAVAIAGCRPVDVNAAAGPPQAQLLAAER